MRRENQRLFIEECERILLGGENGVLALSGGEYPYAVPMNYVYKEGKIFFHCAKEGEKIERIRRNENACFCVIGQDEVSPSEYTTYYKSVIVRGKMEIVEEREEKQAALFCLSRKFNDFASDGEINNKITNAINGVCIMKINIEEVSGKRGSKVKS